MQDKSKSGWRQGEISNHVDENGTKCEWCPRGKLHNHIGGVTTENSKCVQVEDRGDADEHALEMFESDQWDAIDAS